MVTTSFAKKTPDSDNFVPMPPRNSEPDAVSCALAKCLKLACARHFPVRAIGELATILSGGTPSSADPAFWDGNVVWVTPKDLGKPRNMEVADSERRITQAGVAGSSARLLPVGTVLLSSRAPIGHLGVAVVPLCTNQGFKNIVCGCELNSRYVFHMLRGSIGELQAAGRGNTFAEIPGAVVKGYRLPIPALPIQAAVAAFMDALYRRLTDGETELPELPPPLVEQRRIVAKIDELAGRIAEARGLREQAVQEAEVCRAAVLRKTRSDLADSSLPRARLGDITRVTSGGTPSRDVPAFWGGGIPWVKTGELLDADISATEESISEEGLAGSSAKRFPPDTVLVALYGQGQTRGRTGRLMIEATTNQACCAVLPLPARLMPRFTQYWLRSFYYELRQQCYGGAQPNWSGGMIKDLVIVLPPTPEQRRIVAYLDGLQAKVDRLKELQAQAAAELDALLPSILDKAFKGEL